MVIKGAEQAPTKNDQNTQTKINASLGTGTHTKYCI
jgi:hypothetical protein